MLVLDRAHLPGLVSRYAQVLTGGGGSGHSRQCTNKQGISNLVPLCVFHHIIVIHRWGWTLTLNPDGTTTATGPDGRRIFHSHSPPHRDHGPPGAPRDAQIQ